MGESKRRRLEQAATDLTRVLTDKGKLIEAGFTAFAKFVISPDAPPIQLSEMRLAFMAGAEHVWSSMLNLLDEDKEPTADDMRRMEMIQREIDEWRAILSNRVDPPKGSA
jgi:hypothetical protein